MPFATNGFLEERVARARALPREQRSRDSDDFVAAYHHAAAAEAALLERGADGRMHPRQSLTLAARIQALCHIVRHFAAAAMPSLEQEDMLAAMPLCQPLVAQEGSDWRVAPHQFHCSPRNVVKALVIAFHSGALSNWPLARAISRTVCTWLDESGVAEEIAEPLDSLGCWPGCTPTQLQCAEGLLHLFAANQVAGRTAAEREDRRKVPQEAEEVVQAAQRLVALDADCTRYRHLLVSAYEDHNFEAQVAALHSGLQVAERTNCRYHAALGCFELAHCVVHASPDRYSMAEVEGLLHRVDEHFSHVKEWCSASMRTTAKFAATYPRSSVAQRRQIASSLSPQAASFFDVFGPDPSLVCVVAQPCARGAPLSHQQCSGCGRCTGDVKRCSRCKVAVYCSVECQRAHWAAGHKHKCSKLASKEGQAP